MKLWIGLVFLVGCAGPRPWEIPWAAQPVRPPGSESGRYPVDLATVLQLAGANNLDVALVREKVHEAYAVERLADEKFWPSVGLAAVFRRHAGLTQGTDGTFVDVDKQQLFAGGRATLRWEPGEAIFAKLAASQRFDSSLRQLEAVELSIALEAAIAYYDLLRETLRARVAQESVLISEKLAAQLETSVGLGRSFNGDFLRARVQLASNRLGVARARESARLASIRITSILRIAPDIELVPSESEPVALSLVPPEITLEQALQEAMKQRPEIQEAQAELAASRHEKNAATWGALIPEIYAEAAPGELGPNSGNLRDTVDYLIMVGWRIGPGGLFDPGRQQLTDARFIKAEIALERTRQKVAEQVYSAWNQLQSRLEQMKIVEQAVKDAEEALDLNIQRQSTGVGLPLEVIQAEEALTRIRIDSLAGVIDYNQAQLRLFAYRGARLQIR